MADIDDLGLRKKGPDTFVGATPEQDIVYYDKHIAEKIIAALGKNHKGLLDPNIAALGEPNAKGQYSVKLLEPDKITYAEIESGSQALAEGRTEQDRINANRDAKVNKIIESIGEPSFVKEDGSVVGGSFDTLKAAQIAAESFGGVDTPNAKPVKNEENGTYYIETKPVDEITNYNLRGVPAAAESARNYDKEARTNLEKVLYPNGEGRLVRGSDGVLYAGLDMDTRDNVRSIESKLEEWNIRANPVTLVQDPKGRWDLRIDQLDGFSASQLSRTAEAVGTAHVLEESRRKNHDERATIVADILTAKKGGPKVALARDGLQTNVDEYVVSIDGNSKFGHEAGNQFISAMNEQYPGSARIDGDGVTVRVDTSKLPTPSHIEEEITNKTISGLKKGVLTQAKENAKAENASNVTVTEPAGDKVNVTLPATTTTPAPAANVMLTNPGFYDTSAFIQGTPATTVTTTNAEPSAKPQRADLKLAQAKTFFKNAADWLEMEPSKENQKIYMSALTELMNTPDAKGAKIELDSNQQYSAATLVAFQERVESSGVKFDNARMMRDSIINKSIENGDGQLLANASDLNRDGKLSETEVASMTEKVRQVKDLSPEQQTQLLAAAKQAVDPNARIELASTGAANAAGPGVSGQIQR